MRPLAELLVHAAGHACGRIDQRCRNIRIVPEVQRGDAAHGIRVERLEAGQARSPAPAFSRRRVARPTHARHRRQQGRARRARGRSSIAARAPATSSPVALSRSSRTTSAGSPSVSASRRCGDRLRMRLRVRDVDDACSGCGCRRGKLGGEPCLPDAGRARDDCCRALPAACTPPEPAEPAHVEVAADDRRHGVERGRQLRLFNGWLGAHPIKSRSELVGIDVRRGRPEHAHRIGESLDFDFAVLVEP